MSSGEEMDDQRIQRIFNLPVDDPERLRVMREGLRMAEESHGFDPAAPETKNVRRKLRRAKHLKQYEAIMRGSAKHENATYNENYVWGAERFGLNARFYLKMTAALMPRQGVKVEAIKFELQQCRHSIVQWFFSKCPDDYNRTRIINTSKDALGDAFRQINLPPTPTGPPYIAKYDLVTLIEHDNDAVLPPNQAQQHHLTWLVGFVCGVRPDAIGIVLGQPNRFLQWQDVEITRAGPRGSNNFKAAISFRWIKSYRNEVRPTLRFTCAGPTMAQDVTFSIPHRLLAILIRRKMLSDHTTVASLLSGTEQRIAIQQSALSLPVVCADRITGRGLDERRAIFASDISAFFQRRVVAFGLPPNVTPYAWRHPSAANASGEGKDAREFPQQNDVAVKSLTLDGALNPAEDSTGDDETVAAVASSSRMFLEFLVNE